MDNADSVAERPSITAVLLFELPNRLRPFSTVLLLPCDGSTSRGVQREYAPVAVLSDCYRVRSDRYIV